MPLYHVLDKPDGIELHGVSDFSPKLIFECGQNFRFFPDEAGGYFGCAGALPLYVNAEGGRVFLSCTRDAFERVWRRYFDLDRDYGQVRDVMRRANPFFKAASEFGEGIRVLRQDPWETLITFILSQCNNIKRITGLVNRLCQKFGEPLAFRGETLYAFPRPEALAGRSEGDFAEVRAGYRAKYILEAANRVAGGQNLDELAALPTDALREKLLAFPGVGRKVADCVLLFGYGRMEVCPVDVWISRVLRSEDGKEGLNLDGVSELSGLVQQYVFHYARNHPWAVNS